MDNLLAQMTLSLRLKDQATFDNFYPGHQSEIIAMLKNAASGVGERIIFLSGRNGGGRTHLLQAACHHAHLHDCLSVYLPLTHLISLTPDILEGLETLKLVCLDDIHQIAGLAKWEEAVFHLFNRIYDADGTIVITANELPHTLPIALADLRSRLTWGVTYLLHALDDDEKIAMLMMRAECRGMSLSCEVARYIITHCPRHTSTLLAALDALDNASLAAKRRLTVPFVKEVLQI